MMQIVEMTTNTRIMDEADEGAQRLTEYFADLVAQRRAHPRDDLASALVTARDSAPTDARAATGLTEAELLQTLILLFMAGVDTIGQPPGPAGTAALLAHPDRLAALRTDPALRRPLSRRCCATTPRSRSSRPGNRRARAGEAASRPTPRDRPAGAPPTATRSRFPDPDAFDIARRSGASVLSFGGGMHYCLGAPLARIESAEFFPAFLARFPRLALAAEPERRGLVLRGFATLPITVS